MDLQQISEHISPLVKDLIHRFYQLYDTRNNDQITLRTIHFKLVECILGELKISWDQMAQIMKNSVRVHPEHTAKLLQLNGPLETEAVLSQTFIRNDKMVRIIKQYAAQDSNSVDEILAVDGLSGNLNSGPNYDYKHYIQNLRYPSEIAGTEGEEENDIRRLHVFAVRAIYRHLKGRVTQPVKHHVYALLKHMMQTVAELPADDLLNEKVEPICGGMEKECETIYRNMMSDDMMEELAKSFRIREKRSLNAEEEPPAKRTCKAMPEQ